MISSLSAILAAALLTAASPAPQPQVIAEAVCFINGAGAKGKVTLLGPDHAKIELKDGSEVEVWGTFVCFRFNKLPDKPSVDM